MTETRYSSMPTVTDDITKSYAIGDQWEDQSDGVVYECISSKVGVADWKVISVRMSVRGTTVVNAVKASGTITVSDTPVADETLKIGSTTFTFKETRTVAGEITINATPDTQAHNIVEAITADLTNVTATHDTGVVTVTAVTAGVLGNSIDLEEVATGIAVSGAHLANGLDGTPGHLRELVYYDSKLYVSTKEDFTITNDGWLSTTLS